MSYAIVGIKTYKQHLESLNIELSSPTIKFKIDATANDEMELAKLALKMLNEDPKLEIITVDRDGLFVSMYLTKNKIVAARVNDEYSAYMTKLHNNSRALCLNARMQGICNMLSCCKEFLRCKWEGDRHKVRTDMLEHMLK